MRFLFRLALIVCTSGAVLWSCARPAEKAAQPQPTPKSAAAPGVIPVYDGALAMTLLERQVAFGPRAVGTPAHEACRAWLLQELRASMDHAELQEFTATSYEGTTMQMANVYASFAPEKSDRILLCAHWDSRPRADQDKDPAKQNQAIAGANDGASGVGVLLALSRVFRNNPPPIGIDIVFFDGEDYGKGGEIDRYCLGSRHFAKHLPSNFHAQAAILLDLVGDRNAVFEQDPASVFFARDIVNDLWSAAHQVHANQFVNNQGKEVFDDHMPLNIAGIRTVDIIDAGLIGNEDPDPRRRYWHTTGDTPENCSAATLQAVGSTLMQYLYTPRSGQ